MSKNTSRDMREFEIQYREKPDTERLGEKRHCSLDAINVV